MFNEFLYVLGWIAIYGLVFFIAWRLAKWAEGEK